MARILYHYTSIDALLNGIIVNESKNNKDVCLWATHSEYLNDKTEIKYSRDIIIDEIMKFQNGKYQEIFNYYNDLVFEETFILSFSEAIDSIPMWSMYGKNGNGISLGFQFYEDDERIAECKYLNENEVTQEIQSKLNQMELSPPKVNELYSEQQLLIYNELYYKKFTIKPPSFKYEKEFRMFIDPSSTAEQQFGDFGPHSQINFRISNNMLIPYYKWYFPKQELSEIIIGPIENYTLAEKSLRLFLDKHGFSHTIIKKSACPLRT